MTAPPSQINVGWPGSPELFIAYGPSEPSAWVTYKLVSARWYTDTLERLGQETNYAHYVGVEMALDGALTSLVAAFDAAHRALLAAVYAARGLTLHRVEQPAQYGPMLEREGGDIAEVHQEVTGALEAIKDAEDAERIPVGWLVKLRYLRNRAVHESNLVRVMVLLVPNPQSTG